MKYSMDTIRKILEDLRDRGMPKEESVAYAKVIGGNPKAEEEFLKLLKEHPIASYTEIDGFLTEALVHHT